MLNKKNNVRFLIVVAAMSEGIAEDSKKTIGKCPYELAYPNVKLGLNKLVGVD